MTTIKISASCPYEIGDKIVTGREIHPPELAFWEREQILPPIKDMPLHGPRKPDDVP